MRKLHRCILTALSGTLMGVGLMLLSLLIYPPAALPCLSFGVGCFFVECALIVVDMWRLQ